MPERGPCDGVLAIVRFNWPWYLVAIGVLAASLWFAVSGHRPAIGVIAAVAAAWFLIASLAAAHWIYDRSDLYRFGWLARALPAPATRAVFCHTGFDDCSNVLAHEMTGAQWRVLDHHAAPATTEASLQRARRRPPQTPAEPAPHDHWPVADASADAVFGILAIHEFRKPAQLIGWFREAKRCLAPGGRIVVVEHPRNLANALAFGPGVRHFHPMRRWRDSWQAAGLLPRDQFRVTPFLRVFVLTAP